MTGGIQLEPERGGASAPTSLSSLMWQAIGVRRAVCIASEVLDALADLHDRGEFHGALQPGLIQLTTQDHPSETATLLPAEMMLCTLDNADAYARYRPGNHPSEANTGRGGDLYAVGAILHEMLTGKNIQLTESTSEGARGTEPTFRPLLSSLPSSARSLEPVLTRLMHGDPRQRFPDARAAKQALEQCLSAPTPSQTAAPVPVARVSHRSSSPKPKAVTRPRRAAPTDGFAVSGTLAVDRTSPSEIPERTPATVASVPAAGLETPPRRGDPRWRWGGFALAGAALIVLATIAMGRPSGSRLPPLQALSASVFGGPAQPPPVTEGERGEGVSHASQRPAAAVAEAESSHRSRARRRRSGSARRARTAGRRVSLKGRKSRRRAVPDHAGRGMSDRMDELEAASRSAAEPVRTSDGLGEPRGVEDASDEHDWILSEDDADAYGQLRGSTPKSHYTPMRRRTSIRPSTEE